MQKLKNSMNTALKMSLISTVMASALMSGNALAAPQSSTITGVSKIHGSAPYLKKVGVTGLYREGGTLKINTAGGAPFYDFGDDDLDDDGIGANNTTAATVKWYIVDAAETNFPAGAPIATGSDFLIPAGNQGKKVVLSIEPTSRIGLPRNDPNNTIRIMDITKYLGQSSNGQIDPTIVGSVVGTDSTIALVDENTDGLIDSDIRTYKVRIVERDTPTNVIVDETGVTSGTAIVNARANTAYQVFILEDDKAGGWTDATAQFTKSIQWQLVDDNSTSVTAPAGRLTNDNAVFTTQTLNTDAIIQSVAEESEQGTRIQVTFDNDPAAAANQ